MNGTLTLQNGLLFDLYSVEGRAAFIYGTTHMIVWHSQSNGYNFLEKGEPVYWSRLASECLVEADRIILDYFATCFIPTWEQEEVDNGSEDQGTSATETAGVDNSGHDLDSQGWSAYTQR